MARRINLLPEKLKVKESILNLYQLLRVVGIVGTLVFFVAVLVIVFIIVVNDRRLKEVTGEEERLTSEIKSLSTVEKRYVILKNRANLLAEIKKEGPAKLEEYAQFVDQKPAEISLGEVSLSPINMELTSSTLNALVLFNFFDSLVGDEVYKQINLNNFGYEADSGFSMDLEMFF